MTMKKVLFQMFERNFSYCQYEDNNLIMPNNTLEMTTMYQKNIHV